eukprot:UN29879
MDESGYSAVVEDQLKEMLKTIRKGSGAPDRSGHQSPKHKNMPIWYSTLKRSHKDQCVKLLSQSLDAHGVSKITKQVAADLKKI